jgi:hypothetical protein
MLGCPTAVNLTLHGEKMALVTITFEDDEDGVRVRVESNPAFPGPEATQEQHDALTDAQQMGMRMTMMITEEYAHHEQAASECCNHSGCGCHPEAPDQVVPE